MMLQPEESELPGGSVFDFTSFWMETGSDETGNVRNYSSPESF